MLDSGINAIPKSWITAVKLIFTLPLRSHFLFIFICSYSLLLLFYFSSGFLTDFSYLQFFSTFFRHFFTSLFLIPFNTFLLPFSIFSFYFLSFSLSTYIYCSFRESLISLKQFLLCFPLAFFLSAFCFPSVFLYIILQNNYHLDKTIIENK